MRVVNASDLRMRRDGTEPSSREFGVTRSGASVAEFAIRNRNGIEVRAIEYGAAITCIRTPDRTGRRRNIVLSYETLKEYEQCSHYVGAVVGRFAGRIKNGEYDDDGALIRLDRNENTNHLHGGIEGFHKAVWRGEAQSGDADKLVTFTNVSRAGAGGFPGELKTTVRYRLSDDDILTIEFEAETDAPTHVNLTPHAYFNLAGAPFSSVADHELEIRAERRLALDEGAVPTGEYSSVAQSDVDFRKRRVLGEAAEWLDHDFVISGVGNSLKKAATLYHALSGRRIDVATDQPSLHIYAGGKLEGGGKSTFLRSAGICLETQKFPNAPNIPAFPSTRLEPGQTYRHRTQLSFSAE
jgi:aldose 1-epimerase